MPQAMLARVTCPNCNNQFQAPVEQVLDVRADPSAKSRVFNGLVNVASCPHCGTAIYATSTDDEPKAYNVRLGALRQRNELVPRRQIFVCSQQPWVNDLDSIRKFDRMPH